MDARQQMRDLGVGSDPEEWHREASAFTGGETTDDKAILSGVVNDLAKKQGIVRDANDPGGSTMGLQLEKSMQAGGDSMLSGSPTAKFLGGLLKNASQGKENGAETYSVKGLMDMLKEVNGRIATNPLTENEFAQTNQFRMKEHDILPQVRSILHNALYNGAEMDQAARDLRVTPDIEAKIQSSTKNPQLQQFMRDTINNAQGMSDLTKPQQLFVNADKIAKSTLKFEQGPTQLKQLGQDVAQAQKLQGQSADSTLGLLMQGKPIRAGLAALGGATQNVGKLATAGSDILGSKIGKASVPALAGAGAASLPSALGIPLGGTPGGDLSRGGPGTPPSLGGGGTTQAITAAGNRMDSGGDNRMSPLQQAFQDELNTQNAQQVFAEQTGGMGGSFGGAASLGGNLSALAPQLQNQQLVGSLIGGLGGLYQNAPTGLLGGLESLVPGTSANVYARQAAGTSGALAHLLGMSPAAAYGLMPSLTQPGQAQQQFGNLGGLLGQLGG
jgi:hypothetical protein